MKASKKRPACLNCGRPLLPADNYCPNCGQQNTSHKMGFGTLLDDFFSNLVSFDSKLARSIVPFLFRPGCLTRRFNEGKRISYVHPLRLYFIISFVFFFLLSLLINTVVEENKFSLKAMIDKGNADSMQQPVAVPVADSLVVSLQPAQSVPSSAADSAQTTAATAPKKRKEDWDSRFVRLMRTDSLTDAQVMDSLEIDKNSLLKATMVHQGRKVLQKDVDMFLPYLIKNLSIMMFLMLPLFAFFLWVLFRRREPFYISHVIHALHMHAFSFLLLSLFILLQLFNTSGNLLLYAFLLITLYAFISIKKVYQQGWLRTFFKFTLLGFFYFTALNIALLLEVGISFMLF